MRMSPAQSNDVADSGSNGAVGPHPSYIRIARPYYFEQKLQECMSQTGVSEAKEDSIRLQGVAWIDNVRKALRLYSPLAFVCHPGPLLTACSRPVRTFNTAAVYYHRFRLVHADHEYSFIVRMLLGCLGMLLTFAGCGGRCPFHGLQDRGYLEAIKGNPLCCVQPQTPVF